MIQKDSKGTFLLLHVDIYNSFIQPEILGLLRVHSEEYTIHAIEIKDSVKYTIITSSYSVIDYILSKSLLISRAVKIPCNYMTIKKEESIAFLKESIEKNTYKIKCVGCEKDQTTNQLIYDLDVPNKVDLTMPSSIIYAIKAKDLSIVGVLYKESRRKDLLKYSVKERKFIGNTSMDSELSFIICNASGVSEKTVLLDCCAGSGSILLSGAIQGSLVIGTDINGKQFKGRDTPHTNPRIKTQLPNTTIHSNFKMYGISDRVLTIGIHDLFDHLIFRNGTVDVILCDPPYGERETVKKRASDTKNYMEGEDRYMKPTVPFLDRIIEVGKRILKNKGKIGIFIPHTTGYTPQFKETDCVRKISQSEQYLNSLYSRTFFLLEITK